MSVCALLPLHPPREPVLHGSVLWVWLLCPDNLRARVCIHTCLHMFCLFVLNCVSVRAIAHGDCVNQRVHAHVLDCVSQRVHAHVLDCVSQCVHAHVSAYVLCVCLCLTVSVRAIAHGDCVSQRVHAHVLDCVSQCAHAHVSAYVLCVCLCSTVCLCVRLHMVTV